MSDLIDADGFRANVGIVLMHREQVFLGRRSGGRGWQFPQGGVRSGEELEQALYRELEEEIGVGKASVDLVGQKQRWFLLRLRSDDVAFDFERTPQPEFDHWRWVSYWEPVKEVIYFKRPVYARALTELAGLAFPRDRQPPLPAWWDKVTARGRREEPAPAD